MYIEVMLLSGSEPWHYAVETKGRIGNHGGIVGVRGTEWFRCGEGISLVFVLLVFLFPAVIYITPLYVTNLAVSLTLSPLLLNIPESRKVRGTRTRIIRDISPTVRFFCVLATPTTTRAKVSIQFTCQFFRRDRGAIRVWLFTFVIKLEYRKKNSKDTKETFPRIEAVIDC